jgi:hypothetical protein
MTKRRIMTNGRKYKIQTLRCGIWWNHRSHLSLDSSNIWLGDLRLFPSLLDAEGEMARLAREEHLDRECRLDEGGTWRVVL